MSDPSALVERIRPAVRGLRPYQPGKPIEEVQRELGLSHIIKLASNEYPEGPFPEVRAALERELAELHRYPDASWHELLSSATSLYPIERDEILFGNGANEILELVVHLLCGEGDEVVYAHPSFPIYGLLAQSHFDTGKVVPLSAAHVHDLDAMAAAITPRTRVIFLCNPNNPTGTYFGEDALVGFLERVPEDVLVVLDEAYVEFVTAPDFPDFFRLRQRFANLLSVRSFSKVYSIAALRIGYAIGHRDVIGMLQRVRQPFNVNRLAQKAAAVALRQQERVVQRRLTNRQRMETLGRGLEQLGCRVVPSQTNFYLAFTPEPTTEVFSALLREGVIVRPMHSFGLGEGSFRVNTGTEEENAIFLHALERVLGATAGA
jgi:histidinol-phosphate aminotransferase